MTRSRTILATAASIAAIGIFAMPAASMADELTLYTWSFVNSDPVVGGFSTTSPVDASLQLLGADTYNYSESTSGVEVCGGNGYAIRGGFDSSNAPAVSTFDISTGAILTGPTNLTIDGGEVDGVREADTLADCTLLTLVEGGTEQDGPFVSIASVNPTSGAITLLVPLFDELDFSDYTGIATSPSGVTYLFATINSLPQVATVDLSAGSYTTFTELAGLGSYYESEGFTLGVDFDAAGGFWAVNGVDREELYHLSSFAAGADLTNAEPVDIGVLPYVGAQQIDWPIPLATNGLPVISPAAPQLAATGSGLPLGALAAGVLLVGAGLATGIAARRRRTV